MLQNIQCFFEFFGDVERGGKSFSRGGAAPSPLATPLIPINMGVFSCFDQGGYPIQKANISCSQAKNNRQVEIVGRNLLTKLKLNLFN